MLITSALLGMGGVTAYYYVSQPAPVTVITPSPQTSIRIIRAPTPHASTHYVTEPPVIVQPSHQAPAARPQPSLSQPSSGSANIPGVPGYIPPSTTGGEPPPPSTDNPTPGVTAPSPSPSSPSQGGF